MTSTSKLALNKETLCRLGAQELGHVQGGGVHYPSCGGDFCVIVETQDTCNCAAPPIDLSTATCPGPDTYSTSRTTTHPH